MNRPPPKTTNKDSTGGLFGSYQCPDDSLGASNNNAGNTLSKDTQLRQPTNQFDPPLRYYYLPSQPPCPGTPQFYHSVQSDMTQGTQLGSGATTGYPSYGPLWPENAFHERCFGGPQMSPPPQFTGHGPSSPGAPHMHVAPPGMNPIIRPTSSTSTPQGQHSSAPVRPPMSLQM